MTTERHTQNSVTFHHSFYYQKGLAINLLVFQGILGRGIENRALPCVTLQAHKNCETSRKEDMLHAATYPRLVSQRHNTSCKEYFTVKH